MELFLKTAALALITVILNLVLEKSATEFAALLGIFTGCLILLTAMACIRPVVEFVQQLQTIANLNAQFLTILLKAVGLSTVSQIAALICTDSGNAALGKAITLLASILVLCLSLPLFQALLDLVGKILNTL